MFILKSTHQNFSFRLDGIRIRKCGYEDIGGVIYVNRKTLPENYSYQLFLSMLRIFRDIFYVAVDVTENRVVGYCMNKIEFGVKSFFGSRRVNKGHIFSVGVLREYRRRGIASALIAISMQKIFEKGCDEVFLEVRVSNTPAQNLYRKFNFDIVARIPRYYADGEDAYVMATTKERAREIVHGILSDIRGYIEED